MVLVTSESGTIVSDAIDSMLAAHRRMATASAGAVQVPEGEEALVVHRDGTTWTAP